MEQVNTYQELERRVEPEKGAVQGAFGSSAASYMPKTKIYTLPLPNGHAEFERAKDQDAYPSVTMYVDGRVFPFTDREKLQDRTEALQKSTNPLAQKLAPDFERTLRKYMNLNPQKPQAAATARPQSKQPQKGLGG